MSDHRNAPMFAKIRIPKGILLALALFSTDGVANAAAITWAPPGTNYDWDLVTANWTNGINPVLYADGDDVTFNDPTADQTISVVGTLAPNSISISSVANNYTFNGTGTFAAALFTTKSGAGTATFDAPAGNTSFGPDLYLTEGKIVLDGATADTLYTADRLQVIIGNNAAIEFKGYAQYRSNVVSLLGYGDYSHADVTLSNHASALLGNGGATYPGTSDYIFTDIGASNGSATLTMSDDSSITNNTLVLMFGYQGGSAEVHLSGNASINQNLGTGTWIQMANHGTATLEMQGNASVNAGNGILLFGWDTGAADVTVGRQGTTDTCKITSIDTNYPAIFGCNSGTVNLNVNGNSSIQTQCPIWLGSGNTWAGGATESAVATLVMHDYGSIQMGLSGAAAPATGQNTAWGSDNYMNNGMLTVKMYEHSSILNKNAEFSIGYASVSQLFLNDNASLTETYDADSGVLNICSWGGGTNVTMTGASTMAATGDDRVWMGMWTSSVTAVVGTLNSTDTCNITSGGDMYMAYSGGHIDLTINGNSSVAAGATLYIARGEDGGYAGGSAKVTLNDNGRMTSQGPLDFCHGAYWVWYPDGWHQDPLPTSGTLTMSGTSLIDVGLNGAADQASNIAVIAGSSTIIEMSGSSKLHNSNNGLALGSEGGIVITMKDSANISQLKVDGDGLHLGSWGGGNSLTMQDHATFSSATNLWVGWNAASTTVVAGRTGNLADDPAISCGGNLTIGADWGAQGSITLNGKSSLLVGGISRIGAGGPNGATPCNGSITVNDSATATFTGKLTLASNDAAVPSAMPTGSLTINDNAVVLTPDGFDLALGGSTGSITINGGSLTDNGPTTVGVTGSITIGSAGSLDIGPASVFSSAAPISNDGLLTVEGNAVFENLTGIGITHVADGGVLTAVSITQDTLAIGGPARAAAVPEPSVLALLVLAGLGALLVLRRK